MELGWSREWSQLSVPVATRSHCSGSSSLEGDNFVCLQGVGSRENNPEGLMALKGLVRVLLVNCQEQLDDKG